MGEHGQVTQNSIALNKQDGQGAQKPPCSGTGSASHEYKPAKPAESSVPMPK